MTYKELDSLKDDIRLSSIEKEVEEDYNNLWKDIIENEDGSVNIEQVKKELYDYSKLMDRTMKLYDELTLGCISKYI